jgi:hypothetical protein
LITEIKNEALKKMIQQESEEFMKIANYKFNDEA